MDIIPEVIKHKYPIKGDDMSDIPNNVKQYCLTPHHFLGTGVMPIPTVMPTPFMKFNTAHKLMMGTYRNEPTQPVLGTNGQPIKRRMYLQEPVNEQHNAIPHLCQVTNIAIRAIMLKDRENHGKKYNLIGGGPGTNRKRKTADESKESDQKATEAMQTNWVT